MMEKDESPLHIFDTYAEVKQAIKSLGRSGLDVKKLSLVGKGYHSEEHPVGFHTVGDRIRSWRGTGAFWGGVWGLVLAPAVFFLPGLGFVAVAGPLVAALGGALKTAGVVGSILALGTALTQVGLGTGETIEYETALKMNKYVLVVHGSAEEVANAAAVLSSAEAWETA